MYWSKTGAERTKRFIIQLDAEILHHLALNSLSQIFTLCHSGANLREITRSGAQTGPAYLSFLLEIKQEHVESKGLRHAWNKAGAGNHIALRNRNHTLNQCKAGLDYTRVKHNQVCFLTFSFLRLASDLTLLSLAGKINISFFFF